MPRAARVPRPLAFLPFRDSAAVADGLLSGRMLRGAEWRRLLPDVYVRASAELDHRTWCDAVALVLPAGAAIGGPSAAYLWGVNLLAHDAPVTVVVPRVMRMRPHKGIRIVRSALPPADITRFAGLPVTTPLRTAFDLARSVRTEGVVALDALLCRRVVRLDALREYAAGHARWPGMPTPAMALSLAEPLAESPMETRLRLLLIDAGLPRPVAQHRVSDRGRFVARIDLAYSGWRIGIEYEGDHHRERAVFGRDIARLNALREAGWLVLRFTADDVLRAPARVVRLVRAAIAERTHERYARDAIGAP